MRKRHLVNCPPREMSIRGLFVRESAHPRTANRGTVRRGKDRCGKFRPENVRRGTVLEPMR